MYFRNYGLRRKWLDKHLKIPLSERCSTAKMLQCPEDCLKLKMDLSLTFSIPLKKIELEVVFLGYIRNISSVC